MRRLIVVTNIPTPYRVPLFNALAERLGEAGWELEVAFGSRGNARRLWKIDEGRFRFRHHVLGGKNVRLGTERILNTYRGLGRLLEERRPDGIVCAGYSSGTMRALAHAARFDVPLAIWSGTVPGNGAWWRRLQRRWVVRRADAFLAYGTDAREYLRGLGAPEDRVFIAWNTVDTSRFESLPGARAPGPGETLRLLTVGYLEPRKRVDLAVRAVAAARERGLAVELDVVGEGSDRPGLEALARELGVAARVRFLGYRDYGPLQESFAQAHVFLFPTSRDIWGLVLVEAMAAGLPCLASTRAGGTRDLVVEGETGFALDFEDTDAVVGRLAELGASPPRVAAMGEAARERVRSRFTLAHSSAGWVELVERW